MIKMAAQGNPRGQRVALINEKAFLHLEAPPMRVTGFDTPFPYPLEMEYLPLAHRILPAIVDRSPLVIAIGTETDGSIVCPSSVNGVAGLKPTVGNVPNGGLIERSVPVRSDSGNQSGRTSGQRSTATTPPHRSTPLFSSADV
jgi:hypothetical protein